MSQTQTDNWIEVDREGLREVFPRKYVVRELIANMWDEMINGAKNGYIAIIKDNTFGEGNYKIIAKDDAPKGFRDLTDSFTMFRYTDKRKNPEVRGRFNSGDKYVLAHSIYAEFISTTGTYWFKSDGKKVLVNDKTDEGSILTFHIPLTEEEISYIFRTLKFYKPPKGFKMVIDYDDFDLELRYKKPIKTTSAVLTTWQIDEEDNQQTIPRRKTKIYIYEEKTSYLYEMGIPVQEIEDRFSYDIQQKIPLDQNREMVKDSYLREVRGACANAIADLLSDEDITETWVSDALESDNIDDDTVADIAEKKFPNSVFWSSDPRANERAIEDGKNIIHGSNFSKKARERIRSTGAIQSSSVLFPTNFKTAERMARSEINEDMKRVEKYAKRLARELLDVSLTVDFINDRHIGNSASYGGLFGSRLLTFNLANLQGGKTWFRLGNVDKILRLILHELSHEFSSDDAETHHLTREYVDGIQKVFGDALILMRDEPEFFDLSRY